MAEPSSNPLSRPLPDGIVPAQVVARTEKHWLMVMVAMLVVMMAVIVATGIVSALHPASNVEVIDRSRGRTGPGGGGAAPGAHILVSF